jgi:hypothetical protein
VAGDTVANDGAAGNPVEHIIWEHNGQVCHKVMIYTDEVDNIEATRK